MSEIAQTHLELEPNSPQHLSLLCGQFDEHLRIIEQRLHVHIGCRGNQFQISGPEQAISQAEALLYKLYTQVVQTSVISAEDVHLSLQHAEMDAQLEAAEFDDDSEAETDNGAASAGVKKIESMNAVIRTKKLTIKPRGKNQNSYVRAVQSNDINFGIGPAGTGKTYLAVACAVEALLANEVQRILLVRPAVEAGEKLGFLPGDLSQKIDPYLRPLYDALYEMLGSETVNKLIERNIIEIAPLAYMRGRTLNECFIILDEAQNTTREQMKMFLTRIGFGSTAVINGDATQIDLPRGVPSGLSHALNILKDVNGISFSYFEAKDIVRHPLVQRIVEAYDSKDTVVEPVGSGGSDKKAKATAPDSGQRGKPADS